MSRIDDAVARILKAKFDLGLFEHPLTDRTNIDEIGSKAHRAVARRAVAESQVLLRNKQAHAAAARRKEQGVRRGQQRRQHRQPGRRLDADLAGRLDQRDPRPDRSSTASSRPRRATSSTARRPPRGSRARRSASWSSARRRTPRASATSAARSGPTTPATTGGRGRSRRCRSATADKQAIRTVCARTTSCTVLVVSGRPLIVPPGAAQPDRRAGRVVAAGQRGRRRRRRALRPQPVHRQAAGDLAAHGRPGADQRRRRALRPALPLRVRAQHPPLSQLHGRAPDAR